MKQPDSDGAGGEADSWANDGKGYLVEEGEPANREGMASTSLTKLTRHCSASKWRFPANVVMGHWGDVVTTAQASGLVLLTVS